jgi:hypothetical protein
MNASGNSPGTITGSHDQLDLSQFPGRQALMRVAHAATRTYAANIAGTKCLCRE